jgi:pimeloyl-ACP methyl ester carboxylesterase
MTTHRIAAMLATSIAAAALCSSLAATSADAGQYAKVSDDLQLYYEDVGQGPVMVWVPGWTATTTVFSHQIEHFSKSYRVIAYDPRSQGLSTKTLDHNDYDQHGRDLAGLLDKLELKNIILVGWSAGCYEAYGYVRARGTENLQAFVCIDMPPKSFSPLADDWANWTGTDVAVATRYGRAEKIASDPLAFFSGLLKALNARDLTPDELGLLTRQAMLTPTYATLAEFFGFTFGNYLPEAKQLDGKIPMLNIVNEKDARIAAAWMKTNLPHSATFVIKRHMSHWSEPDTFNAGVDAFLKNVK